MSDFQNLTLEQLRQMAEEEERQTLIARIMQSRQERAQIQAPQFQAPQPPRRRLGPRPQMPAPQPPRRIPAAPKYPAPKAPKRIRRPKRKLKVPKKRGIPKRAPPKPRRKPRRKPTRRPRDDVEFLQLPPPQPPGADNLAEVEENMRRFGDPDFIEEIRQDPNAIRRMIRHIYDNLRLYMNATNKRLVIKIGNRYITLSRRSIRKLIAKLSRPFKETRTVAYDSWNWVEAIVTRQADISDQIEFIVMDREGGPNNDGGFFDKINISPFDLSKLGIVGRYRRKRVKVENPAEGEPKTKSIFVDEEKKLESKITKITEEHCIISTLKYFGFSKDKLDVIRKRLHCNLKKSQLKEIANLLDIRIKLNHYKKNNTLAYYYYGNKNKPEYKIALYNYHYFPYYDFKMSSYMASNWKKYYGIEEGNGNSASPDYITSFNAKKFDDKITKRDGTRKRTVKLNTLSLVRRLDKSGAFVAHKVFNDIAHFSLSKDRNLNLNNIRDECRSLDEIMEKRAKGEAFALKKVIEDGGEILETHIFYADFETVTTTDNKIKPFMVGISDVLDEVSIFQSLDFNSELMMNSIMDKMISNIEVGPEDHIVCYFHNLKFDKTFFDKLRITGKCKKDGQIYSINVLYKGRIIEFRDSYKLIPAPLSRFGGMFNIECAKQVIPYKLYTQDSIKKTDVDIKDAISELKKQLKGDDNMNKKILEFMASAKDFISEEGVFDHMGYMRYYLKMDCVTLGKGLRVFGEKINKVTGLETNNYLTISSLMYGYCQKNKVFKGQFQVTGDLRDYMGKAIFGGRVCTRYNQKHHIKTGVDTQSLISDFDGVSLYPSAIARLCDEIGIPCGVPQKLTERDLRLINEEPRLNTVPYYIVDIKITKVNKHQQIPFICYKNEEGSCVYTNEPPADQIFTIDSITLQDWVDFQEIEYETQGMGIKYTKFDKTFGKVIKELFKARLECKKKMGQKEIYSPTQIAGFNALQQIYKLMLNSAYGKTIIKPSATRGVFLTREKDESEEEYQTKINEYLLKNYNRINDLTKYENYIEVKEIESYKASYNLTPVGVAILSMSKRIMNEVMDTITDLDMPCYYQDTDSMHILKDDIPTISATYREKYGRELIGKQLGQFHNDFDLSGAKDIYSNELIVLGKKCYMDVLQGKSYKDDSIITGEHVRMKGVNKAGLMYQREQLKTQTNKKIYEKLYEGKKLKFDLLHGGAFSIKYNDDHQAEERDEFFRELVFA